MKPSFCHPEFGCDCAEVISQLTQELALARAGLHAIAEMEDRSAAAVARRSLIRFVDPKPEPHEKCGSTCTDECMRMTV